MNFWRKIAGRAVHRPDGGEDCDCPPGLPGADPAFSTAVTALGAKLTKADGRSDITELDAFSEVFQSHPASQDNIHKLYDLARQTTHGFESYARRLAKRYRNCPGLLEDVLDGLFHIAHADGAITRDELVYLETVSTVFGLSPLAFRRIKATHLGLSKDDPYAILAVAPDAPDDQVRYVWKQLLTETHPDRARARGLPPEFVEVAESKSAVINAAFDTIMRERRAMGLSGTA